MRRLLPLASAVLALAVVAASCGGSIGAAATVNGRAIDGDDFEASLRRWSESDEIRALLTLIAPSLTEETAPGTASGDLARTLLRLRVQSAALDELVEERGLVLDEAALEEADGNVTAQFADPRDPAASETARRAVEQFTAEDRAFWVRRQASFTVLAGEPSEDELRAVYEENSDEFIAVCASHILVETQEEADAVVADLAAGQDFATIAAERSIDPGSGAQGGDLRNQDGTCLSRTVYETEFDPTFAAAALGATPGEPTAPVQTQFGFHIIRLDSIDEQSFDEARPQLEEAARRQAEQQVLADLGQALAEADVHINPRYGTWDGESILPPSLATGVQTPDTTPAPTG